MNKFIAGVSATLLLAATAFAQTASTSGSTSSSASAKASKDGTSVGIQSAATITGQLQGSLNAEKAKVGDEVIIKTTRAVKENGKTVIEKGSRLVGRVTEVKQKTKDRAGSEIGVVFDQLKQGDSLTPITATILSVTRVASSTSIDDGFSNDTSMASTTRTSTQTSSGGGLLGGVTNTAGSVVNTATSTAGGVTNAAMNTTGSVLNTGSNTAGSAVGAVGTNIRGLQVSQSADASANGSTTLGMNTGNLKLDSGTVFTVKVSGSSNASSN